MGTRCITALWVILTTLFTLAICFAFISPVWFENKRERKQTVGSSRQQIHEYDQVSLGIARFCHRYEMGDVIKSCKFFTSPGDMPSIAWMISAIIYAIGAVFFLVSLFLAFLCVCMREGACNKLKVAATYIQVIGGKNRFLHSIFILLEFFDAIPKFTYTYSRGNISSYLSTLLLWILLSEFICWYSSFRVLNMEEVYRVYS